MKYYIHRYTLGTCLAKHHQRALLRGTHGSHTAALEVLGGALGPLELELSLLLFICVCVCVLHVYDWGGGAVVRWYG